MILNLSGKPKSRFNLPQTLACNNEPVVSPRCSCDEDYFDAVDQYESVTTLVLVDPAKWELCEALCNYAKAKVCTLDVDVIYEPRSFKFQEYEYTEHCV